MDCSEGGGRKLRHLLEHRGDLVGQVVGCVIIAWIQALDVAPGTKTAAFPTQKKRANAGLFGLGVRLR